MGTRSKRKREEAEIWEDVERGVKQRHDQIIASAKRLEEHFPDANLLALAATDVFVEKAQHTLSARARYMVKYGKWWACKVFCVNGFGFRSSEVFLQT